MGKPPHRLVTVANFGNHAIEGVNQNAGFIVGFVFAWSYERSGSLWGSIVPHGGLNALTLLVAFTGGR